MKPIKEDIRKLILPSHFADSVGLKYGATVSKDYKKKAGQFFTPIEISSFMGEIASPPKSRQISILDPGCGTAILSCSLIEKLAQFDIDLIELTAYEKDNKLYPYAEESLENLKLWLSERKIDFDYKLIMGDFIGEVATTLKEHEESFDYIISNPPYFKLSKNDKRVDLLRHLVKGQPNIYSFFMAVSANLLKKDGELIFIVPRSFASGQYFNSFRDYFFKHICLEFVHLFKSRKKTFKRDKVLQETLILKGVKKESSKVTLSTSEGLIDLERSITKEFQVKEIIDLESKAKILHLPTSEYEERVMRLFKSWSNNLIDYGIQISTGPVVSFRAKDFLFDVYKNSTVFLTQLYWLHNVRKMALNWPVVVSNKSQYINITEKSLKMLVENKNYVFLRRFSSKDDRSRLVAAPYFSGNNPDAIYIGIENKLNYIYSLEGELTRSEVVGISTLLNSRIFDTYFRTFNGNVNVSATEIRLMPFPPIETIREIGDFMLSNNDFSEEIVDGTVNRWFEFNSELVNG